MKIIVWLLFIAAGAAIIHFRFTIYEFTGEWDWANKYLNNTMVAIIMIWMVLIGIGSAYPFGAFDDFSATGSIMKDEQQLKKSNQTSSSISK